ncbi:RHS repeat domain-containing protein [Cohnella sp. GCM10020058]|uniref:RHS repeat domain-containing protein n=1 Tax=Cohnella sp. GCM10020058 TaxID=3317330 RepID=UPI003641DDD2
MKKRYGFMVVLLALIFSLETGVSAKEGTTTSNYGTESKLNSNSKQSSISKNSSITNADDDVEYSLNQELSNKGDYLKYLSQLAYSQEKYELNTVILQTYYDLLSTNYNLHEANATSEQLESLLNEYIKNIEYFKSQVGKLTEAGKLSSSKTSNSNSFSLQSSFPTGKSIQLSTTHIIEYATDTLWYFTPPKNGVYQLTVSQIDLELEDMDYVVLIFADNVPNYQHTITGDITNNWSKLTKTITVNLSGGRTYPISVFSSLGNANFVITSLPIVDLNSPLDLSIPENQYAILRFSPIQTGEYKFFTSPYGGFESCSSNGALIEMFEEDSLENLISTGEETYDECIYSELSVYLEQGNTYFIKLAPDHVLNHDLQTRFQVVSNVDSSLLMKVPTDINKTNTTKWGLEFLTPATQNYLVTTDFYQGIPVAGELPPYTVVEVYNERMNQLLAWGTGATNVSLQGGLIYYVRINGYTTNMKVRVGIDSSTTQIPSKSIYKYDSKGRLLSIQLSNGQVIEFYYDLNGNLLSKKVFNP